MNRICKHCKRPSPVEVCPDCYDPTLVNSLNIKPVDRREPFELLPKQPPQPHPQEWK